MIGAIIIFIVGWSVRKLWPVGILFLALFPAFSVGLGILMRGTEQDLSGRTVQFDAAPLAQAYFTTLLMQAIIFFVAFGLSKLFSKKRKYLDQNEAGQVND